MSMTNFREKTMPNPTDALLTAAIGLAPPWACTHVEFSETDSHLDIVLIFLSEKDSLDHPADQPIC